MSFRCLESKFVLMLSYKISHILAESEEQEFESASHARKTS